MLVCIALHVVGCFNFVAFCFYHMYVHPCIVKEHPSIFFSLPLFNILPSCLLYTFFSQQSNPSFTFNADNASDLHFSMFPFSLYIYKDTIRKDMHFSSSPFTSALHVLYIPPNNLISFLNCYFYLKEK